MKPKPQQFLLPIQAHYQPSRRYTVHDSRHTEEEEEEEGGG